ncbi:MAG: TonB-dependent receptor [Ignavibacteria bacterium]|nr:TonB-dependent receptor [Ignavibacteria bacterium]
MKSYLSILLLIFLLNTNSYSQVSVSGKVIDYYDRKPLVGVSVYLEGTLLGSISDNEGNFNIKKVYAGSYTIIAFISGYEIFKKKIIVQDSNYFIPIELKIKEVKKPEIVVSSARRIQSFQEVPVSMTIIDEDYLRSNAYIELKDYLRFVPSVETNFDNISIRGSSGYQFGSGSRITLLIDGFPFLTADNATPNLEFMSPDIVSRVEILKAPGSSLYGSSAMSGVINIITKEPKNKSLIEAKITSGIYTLPKYEQWQYTKNLRTRNKFVLNASERTKFGDILIASNFTNDESYRKFNKSNTFNFFGKYSNNFDWNSRLKIFTLFNYKYADDGSFWSGAYRATIPPESYDPSKKTISNKTALALEYQSFFGKSSFLSFKSSLFRSEFKSNSPPADTNYLSSTAYNNNNELQINHLIFENSFLTAGISLTNNWVNSSRYGNRKQNIVSFFIQDEFTKVENFIFTGGIRLDYDICDSSKNYFEASPRFAIAYNSPQKFSLRGSIGKGFRVATISERFASRRFSGFTIEPNPNLSPEKSWNIELGFSNESKIFSKSAYYDLSLFFSKYKNLIEPQFDPTAMKPTIRFKNVANAEIKGIDFSFNYAITQNTDLRMSLTFIDPIDLNTKEILKFRSKFHFTTGLLQEFDILNFSIFYKFVSKIVEVDNQLKFILKDYDVRTSTHLVDLNLNLDFKKFNLPIVFSISIQNLLDYYYVDLVGNLAPTRYISFGIKKTIASN